MELDPVSGRSFRNAGFVYYFSRQYDQALSLIKRVHALNINLPEDTFLLGDVYAEKVMYAESVGEFLKLDDKPHALGHLATPMLARAIWKRRGMPFHDLKDTFEKMEWEGTKLRWYMPD